MAVEHEFSKLWRRFGVRTFNLLPAPRMFDVTRWQQPRSGIYHYVPFSHLDLGPDAMWTPVRNANKPPYYALVRDYTEHLGRPKTRAGVNYDRLEREYLRDHDEFRRLLDIDKALLDPRTAIVYDYAKLHLGRRYIITPMTRWHMFFNLFSTVFAKVGELARISERPQFIFIPMPDTLPARTQFAIAIESNDQPMSFTDIFKAASDELTMVLDTDPSKAPPVITRSYEEVYGGFAPWLFRNDEDGISGESFDELPLGLADPVEFDQASPLAMEAITVRTLRYLTDDKLLLAEELHRWLSFNREHSILNVFENEEQMGRVNLVFTEMGKFSILNLGVMNSWRKEDPKDPNGAGYSALAKRLESFYLSMMGLRSEADPVKVVSADVQLPGAVEQITPIAVVGGSTERTPAAQALAEAEGRTVEAAPTIKPSTVAPVAPVVAPATVDTDTVDVSTQVIVPEQDVDAVEPVVAAHPDPLVRRMDMETKKLLRKGVISTAETRRFTRLAESYKTIKLGDETLEQIADVPPELIWDFKPKPMPDIPEVVDKSMLIATVNEFDKRYNKELYHRDTVRMILGVQKGPIAVTGMARERRTDLMSDLHEYSVKLTPASGISTTFKFKLPVIDDQGKYRLNGVRYFARKLKTDKPIRKINGNQVALSSYYPNKLFVTRSEKKVDDAGAAATAAVLKSILSGENAFTNVAYGNTYHSEQNVPRMYSAMAREYSAFDAVGYRWLFNADNIAKEFPDYKGQGTPIAKAKNGKVLALLANGHITDGTNDLGTIQHVLGIPEGPIESLTLTVLDKDIPMGIVLANLYGLKGLTEHIGKPLRRRPRGTKRDTTDQEFEIVFGDEVWVFPRNNSWQTMIWASFNQWHKSLKGTSVADLWSGDGWFMLFNTQGCGSRHLTEIETLNDYFVDPITEDVLKEMKMPTDFPGLLLRASTMLESDSHPHPQRSDETLLRGYERFNGAVYREMVRGIRQLKNSRNPSRSGVSINPYAVMIKLQEDPSISQVEDSNPVRNTKEKENVTLSGTGGRNKRATVRRDRAFHESDAGIRSEANVDSGDVGINYYLSANPNITSLRGTVQGLNPAEASVTQLLSTPGNLAPFTTYDDGKRVGFVSIQQEHAIMAYGTRAAPISTGYDVVLSHRCDPTFATTAEQDGKVIEVTPEYLKVRYKDGTIQTVQLGRIFGTVTGHAVPHTLATTMTVGRGFKAGDNLAYNSGFFEPDYRNTAQVRWKSGVPSYVFLDETNDNFEDSSRISRRLATHLRTDTSHIRTCTMRFDQFPVDALKVNAEVDIDTLLMQISDDVAESVRKDAAGARSMLIDMGAGSPKAKHHGRIERITCVYFGDKEAMHPRLREFVNKFDSYQAKQHKLYGEGVAKSCRISEPVRVDGNLLEFNNVAFQYYITDVTAMGDGDKLVVANQLKSVITGVIDGVYETATEVFPGKGPLQGDVDFSYRAVQARIVNSPILMGIGALCQEQAGYDIADAYFN